MAMSNTEAALYTIDRGKATIDGLLKHDDAEMRRVLRREWLITVGATLDVARRHVERLEAELAQAEGEVEDRDRELALQLSEDRLREIAPLVAKVAGATLADTQRTLGALRVVLDREDER